MSELVDHKNDALGEIESEQKKVVLDVYIVLKPQCNNVDDKNVLNNLVEDLHRSGQMVKYPVYDIIESN